MFFASILNIVFYLFNFLFILTKIIRAPAFCVGVVVSASKVYTLAVGLYPVVSFSFPHF